MLHMLAKAQDLGRKYFQVSSLWLLSQKKEVHCPDTISGWGAQGHYPKPAHVKLQSLEMNFTYQAFPLEKVTTWI